VLSWQWIARRWRALAGGLVVALVLLTSLLHAPFVRARVPAAALARLQDSGIRASADRLDYNLFALTGGLQGVTLTAAGSDTPFFSADAIRFDLPWSVVGGTPAVQSLELDRPRIAIVRQADGSLNLRRRSRPRTPRRPPRRSTAHRRQHVVGPERAENDVRHRRGPRRLPDRLAQQRHDVFLAQAGASQGGSVSIRRSPCCESTSACR
jgi:hypothetical protein